MVVPELLVAFEPCLPQELVLEKQNLSSKLLLFSYLPEAVATSRSPQMREKLRASAILSCVTLINYELIINLCPSKMRFFDVF